MRALLIAVEAYLIAVLIRSRLSPGAGWFPSAGGLSRQLYETLPWLAAIFGAAYAALYARFSAQWNYLASLYNKIKELEVQIQMSCSGRLLATESLADMKASFVEDAEELHLATKPLFAGVILAWIDDDDSVRDMFRRGAAGSGERLALLMHRVRASHCAHEMTVRKRVAKHRRKLDLDDPHPDPVAPT